IEMFPDPLVTSEGYNALDLAAVSHAVEVDEYLGDVGGSEGLKKPRSCCRGLSSVRAWRCRSYAAKKESESFILLSPFVVVDARRQGRADKPGGHRQGNGQHGFLARAAR